MEHRGEAPAARSDKDLVLAFKEGERAAYDEMYARYRPRVYGVCSRILHNSQDAEEAAQETFLRAYQALHRFNGRYQLGAWLARIATNASVDQLRSKSRSPVVGLPNEEDPLCVDAGPEQIVVGDYPRLTEAIGDVKPLHARALAMRSVEGLSHQEIAQRLEMTPNQVKALLHRARSSLRKAWDRAESWALAPVLTMRSLVDERSSTQTSSPLVGAGAMFTPLLAEKMAAAALVVAVALSGIPDLGSVSTPRQPAARPALRGDQVRPERVEIVPRARTEPERVKDKAAVAAPTDDLGRLLETTLRGHDHLRNDPDEETDPDNGDPLSGSASNVTREVVTQVKELVPQGVPDHIETPRGPNL